MRVLVWHVHGGWMDGFVSGGHEYLVPLTPDGGGRSGRDWPPSAIELRLDELADAGVDVVIAQRPQDVLDARRLLRRTAPTVYVEHNTPRENVPESRHPLADRDDVLIAHVTHVNRLLWDTGTTPTVVVEHGVPDPGPLYTGELPRLGAVINEPMRRWRVTGTDLLPAFAAAAPVDVFGIDADAIDLDAQVSSAGDLAPDRLHAELARRRAYVHPQRWTSLGLSLLEAMHLGMPVIALGTTEAFRAVPPEAGAVSSDIDELVQTARMLLADPDEAAARGRAARSFALERYGLQRFLTDWDAVLDRVVEDGSRLTRP
jgi:hypothetical protein